MLKSYTRSVSTLADFDPCSDALSLYEKQIVLFWKEFVIVEKKLWNSEGVVWIESVLFEPIE